MEFKVGNVRLSTYSIQLARRLRWLDVFNSRDKRNKKEKTKRPAAFIDFNRTSHVFLITVHRAQQKADAGQYCSAEWKKWSENRNKTKKNCARIGWLWETWKSACEARAKPPQEPRVWECIAALYHTLTISAYWISSTIILFSFQLCIAVAMREWEKRKN